jgi:ABC-type amino acid transport system permease subunit
MSLWEILRILLLGYPPPAEMIDPNYPAFLQRVGGLSLTLLITAASLALGAPLGVLLAICRTPPHEGLHRLAPWRRGAHRALSATAGAVVTVVRGIPVVILVLLTFYLPYRTLSVYSGVYLSDVIRSGFAAVDEGWIDAARALGLSRAQVLWRIRLPIALRAMVPALLGQAVTVFKDTSVLTVVAVGELTYTARQVLMSQPSYYDVILVCILVMYWAVASAGGLLAQRLQRRWHVHAPNGFR